MVSLAFLTQYITVTDRQKDRRTEVFGISAVRSAITLHGNYGKLQLLMCFEVILSFDTQATDVERLIYQTMPGLRAA